MSNVTRASLPGGSIEAYIAKELLMIAKKAVVFQQLGEKARQPDGTGVTFQFNRYERLPLPQSALADGVDPNSTSMTLSTVSAVSDQWGAFIIITDQAKLTIQHDLVQTAMSLLGYQAAELVDREIINVLLAGTSVSYGGSASTRAGLSSTSTDVFSDLVCQKVVTRLKNRGAFPYEGNNYVGVVDPSMASDLSSGSSNLFTSAAAYSNIKVLMNGEIGMWRGVRWMESNLLPTQTGLAAHSVTTPASPAGTFAAANYRISVAYYSVSTGFLVKVTQNDAVAFSASDSLALTTPNDDDYTYKVFIGIAGGGATAIMYQGDVTTYGTDFLPYNTAISVLAPPVAGDSISGSNIPGTSKEIHFGFVIGKQAFCKVDLQNLQVLVSKGEPTVDNPLLLRRSIGWKMMFKAVIQNEDFIERAECMSAF